MRMQLLRACALLMAVTGAAVAADKPKDSPAPFPCNWSTFSETTDKPNDGTFTVTKPVGTWVRETEVGGAKCRVKLTVTEHRLTLTMDGKCVGDAASIRFDADYAINKESCLFGVIDTCEAKPQRVGDLPTWGKLAGEPFSVRFRVEGDSLSVKEFKGFGQGLGERNGNVSELVAAVCGRYTSADAKLKELPNKSESQHLTPQRIHGGILKAEPPKSNPCLPDEPSQSEDLRVIGEAWRRHWYNDQPSYRNSQRIDGGILGDTPTAFAGPVHVAMAELAPTQPPRAEFVLAKAEELAPQVLPPIAPIPQVVPPPKCDDPPTDAEVLATFGDRAKGFGDVTIVKNNVKDKIDPPQAFPVVGMARLHRCLWECSVYFNDTPLGGERKPKVEVVYIDTDCLRVVPAKDAVVPKRMPEK